MSKNKRVDEYAIDHTQEIFNRFLNLAINRFTWDNLPTGIESRKLEEFLIRYGMVAFFNDDNYGNMILPCFNTSELNVYYEPTEVNVMGHKYDKKIAIDDVVIIRNNATADNDYDDLLTFATRINEIELTMDINLNAQKTPFVVLCDEKERLTFKNIINEVRKFKYAIFGTKNLKMNNVDVLNTSSPYLLDKLQQQKRELFNELLSFLGINNYNVEKRESLIVDEVNANNEFILVNLEHMYEERKKACDLINAKFGTNIEVKKREVYLDGELHDRTERTSEE